MKLREWGKVVWGFDSAGRDADVVVVVGWGDRRVRLDIGRTENIAGWQRRVTTVRGWKILRYGIMIDARESFSKTWAH